MSVLGLSQQLFVGAASNVAEFNFFFLDQFLFWLKVAVSSSQQVLTR